VLTARDLLYHIPRRYDDASTVRPIGGLQVGEDVTALGRVRSKGVIPTRRGLRIFQAVLEDESGMITAAWPGQPWLDRKLREGDVVLVTGDKDLLQLVNDRIRVLDPRRGGEDEVLYDEQGVRRRFGLNPGQDNREIILVDGYNDTVDAGVDVYKHDLSLVSIFTSNSQLGCLILDSDQGHEKNDRNSLVNSFFTGAVAERKINHLHRAELLSCPNGWRIH